MLEREQVRTDLSDDLNITGILGQIDKLSVPISAAEYISTSIQTAFEPSNVMSRNEVTSMTSITIADWQNKHKELCLLTKVEEQLSNTLNFQSQLLKSLPPVTLNAVQQLMLHNLLHRQALPVSFRSANNQSTTDMAQRMLDYNLGTMLP